MFYLFKPSSAAVEAFIREESGRSFSYTDVGATRIGQQPAGFDHDYNTIELGKGETVFAAAKEAVRQWKMFPGGWASIAPGNTPIGEGAVVAMLANLMGTWWLNSCRIVYVVDEEQRFGFAYGTLPGHAECGEELFLVDMDESGTVRYSLSAFSRPRNWLARLAYPLARAYQRKFVRDSKASMLGAVS